MFAGWNLGNSLEVPADETAWGNPKTTQRLIDSVKARGINTIRIPCAWNSYIEDASTCKLKSSWLDRVKEVVDYCFNNGMFVIINIHWDGGWLENNPTYDKQIAVNAKQKALWEQIAVKFRDYEEHLLFAGTNEVHTDDNATSENYIVQMSYNKTFVEAVRSTGGKNAYRNLIIQAYNTNIDMAVSNLIVPDDSADDRLLVEVHYYDPWDFCGLEADASWGTVKYLWGTLFTQYGTISTWGQEDYVSSQFRKMKINFVDKGYPVLLGEFGATRRLTLTGSTLEHHLASRAYYFQYVAQQAKNNGLVPIIWDNGYAGNLGSAIFDRNDGSVLDSQALNAFVEGASSGTYPF
jgi:endoglucanase